MSGNFLDPVLMRTLIAASEEASFSKAGERLGLTQQAVSAQIKKLESLAGRRLAERRNTDVRLTSDGEALVAYARLLSATTERIRLQFSALPLHGSVRIGVVEGFATSGLAAVLVALRKTHPDLEVFVETAETDVLLARLRSGSLDLAFGGQRRGQGCGEIIAQVDVGWYGDLEPYLDESAPVRLIARPEPNLPRTMAIEALTRVGRPYGVVFESKSRAIIQLATMSGLGVSVFATLFEAAKARPTNGILPDLEPAEFFVATRVRTETVVAVSEMVKQSVLDLIQGHAEHPY